MYDYDSIITGAAISEGSYTNSIAHCAEGMPHGKNSAGFCFSEVQKSELRAVRTRARPHDPAFDVLSFEYLFGAHVEEQARKPRNRLFRRALAKRAIFVRVKNSSKSFRFNIQKPQARSRRPDVARLASDGRALDPSGRPPRLST